MNQEFKDKLENMLVVPFMVILYSCILVPLSILCYQRIPLAKNGRVDKIVSY
jgi:hypothetical protein